MLQPCEIRQLPFLMDHGMHEDSLGARCLPASGINVMVKSHGAFLEADTFSQAKKLHAAIQPCEVSIGIFCHLPALHLVLLPIRVVAKEQVRVPAEAKQQA